jgi:trk system potassium uptake protein TrkA
VKRPGADFEYARPDTTVPSSAVLIVAGTTDAVQRFAAAT